MTYNYYYYYCIIYDIYVFYNGARSLCEQSPTQYYIIVLVVTRVRLLFESPPTSSGVSCRPKVQNFETFEKYSCNEID